MRLSSRSSFMSLETPIFVYVHRLNNDEVPIEQDMFEPLYPGARITVCGAYCAIMEFKWVCKLPFTAIAMLLQLFQLLCPLENKLPRSVYMFFQRYATPHTKRLFCASCSEELKGNQKHCRNASCPRQEPNSLIHIPSDRALRRIVTSKQYIFSLFYVMAIPGSLWGPPLPTEVCFLSHSHRPFSNVLCIYLPPLPPTRTS